MISLKQVWLAAQRCRPSITEYPDCTGLIINLSAKVGLSREAKNALVDEGKYVVTTDDQGSSVLLGR